MTFEDMISTVIYINNQMYKWWLEKESINALIVINKSSR